MSGLQGVVERSAHINECVQEQVLVQFLQAGHTGFGVLCPIDLSRRRGRRACSSGKEQRKVSADADGKVLACSSVPSSSIHRIWTSILTSAQSCAHAGCLLTAIGQAASLHGPGMHKVKGIEEKCSIHTFGVEILVSRGSND